MYRYFMQAQPVRWLAVWDCLTPRWRQKQEALQLLFHRMLCLRHQQSFVSPPSIVPAVDLSQVLVWSVSIG